MRQIAPMLAAALLLPALSAAASQSGLYSTSGVSVSAGTFTGSNVFVPGGTANTLFAGPPAGMSAGASASQQVKRAVASFGALSADTSSVTSGEFGSLAGYAGNTSFFPGNGGLSTLRASAIELGVVYPSSSRLVQFGVFLDRSVATSLLPHAGVVATYVNGFAAANGVSDPNAVIGLEIGSLYAAAEMEVTFTDRTNTANRLSYSVFSSRKSAYFIETTLARIAVGDYSADISESSTHGINLGISDIGSPYSFDQFLTDVSPDNPVSATAAYVTTQPFWLRANRTYEMSVGLSCRVDVSHAARFFVGSSASCDADRSGYWNGVVSAFDESGEPASLPDLIDENGVNFRFASPLSPAPPVPEPSTWMMLIAGFGLVVATLRRRRAGT